MLQGKVSVADMIAFSPSEVVASKYDGKGITNKHILYFLSSIPWSLIHHFFSGSLKYWESSITLVNIIKNEIRDGQLSFRGKRVLEVTFHEKTGIVG